MTPEYKSFVTDTLRPWIQEHIEEGDFHSKDGIRIHYYESLNPHEKASIVMVHGFCEFFGKYHETAMRFYEAGYSIFFLELRGYGKSERTEEFLDERVYVDSFDEYVEDLHSFVEEIVKKKAQTDRYFLFSHSMGGAVSTLYLEEYPETFKCCVLSSPMLQVNYGNIPDLAVDALAVYSKVKEINTDYAPGQGSFSGEPDFEGSCCMDEDRYAYQFALRKADRRYQTWGGTWAWVRAAKDGSEKARKYAYKVKTPILLCQAGKDSMVRLQGQNEFDRNCSAVTLICFQEAKHELFNATKEIREEYYKAVLTYFKAYE